MGLPERRNDDRREKPGAGYGKKASRDPFNRRFEIRRWWKNRRGRGRPGPPPDPWDEGKRVSVAEWLRRALEGLKRASNRSKRKP